MPGYLIIGVGLASVLATGALYGHYGQRWGPPPQMEAAAEHVAAMPEQIGPWQMAEELPISETAVEMLQCEGHAVRRYVHTETGESVNVAVLLGPAGPIAVHTPEICYTSRAYEQETKRDIEAINGAGEEHTFWRTDFKTRNVLAEQLAVYYAWSTGDKWIASQSPRFEYGGQPLLYKIQLSCLKSPGAKSNACQQFLEALTNSPWRPGP